MRRKWPWALATIIAVVTLAFVAAHKPTPVPLNASADKVIVQKHAHTMALYHQGQLLRTYHVALGRGGLAPKSQAGDDRVPEGTYRITGRNPHSAFHRALRIGYPTPQQIDDAKKRGVDPGGDIMVHGIRNGLGWLGPLHRNIDWTKGCIAVTDSEIDEIWQAMPDGTPIEIRP